LYIRTQEPPPGSFIELLFDVPAGQARARALEQWSKPKDGKGVQSIARQPEDRGRLAQWLDTLFV